MFINNVNTSWSVRTPENSADLIMFIINITFASVSFRGFQNCHACAGQLLVLMCSQLGDYKGEKRQ